MLLRNADIPVSQNLFVHFGYLIQIEAVYDCALCEISQDTWEKMLFLHHMYCLLPAISFISMRDLRYVCYHGSDQPHDLLPLNGSLSYKFGGKLFSIQYYWASGL